LTGEPVRRVTSSGFNPAWSPDGEQIVYATEGVDNPKIRKYISEIYRVSLEGGPPRLLHEGDAVQPSWSPNGWRIAYWGIPSSGRRMIWTLPAGGGKEVPVTDGQSVDWNPVWSPDGRHLYFASDRGGVTNLWRVPIDERTGSVLGEAEQITNSSQANILFSLSRDGRHIIYSSEESKAILEKVPFEPASDPMTGPAEEVVQTSDMIATLDASRDGRWLVYQTLVPQEDLFLVHPDGTGLRRLTDDEHMDRQPRWSPDGTRIAFYSNRGGPYHVWTVPSDGGEPELAAILPGREAFHPIWSPDSQTLACDLDENEALIDLTRPMLERRPRFLPKAGGLGFSASSWSADGRWLAGNLHRPDGSPVPGVVLFSLSEWRYVRLTDRGTSATWLSDSRRLLYLDGTELLLLDTRSGTSRQVLTIPPGSDYNDFCLSPDNHVLYVARIAEEGNIWLLTMN
jgi:Tol biopolymer transport system component